MTIFPFLISYDTICNYLLQLTNNIAISQETCIIAYILINFINIWFILTIAKIIIRTFNKIIKTLF